MLCALSTQGKGFKSYSGLLPSFLPFSWWWTHIDRDCSVVVRDVYTDCCALRCVRILVTWARGWSLLHLAEDWIESWMCIVILEEGNFPPSLWLAGSSCSFFKRTCWRFYVGALCSHFKHLKKRNEGSKDLLTHLNFLMTCGLSYIWLPITCCRLCKFPVH